jgi:hypothetical protein
MGLFSGKDEMDPDKATISDKEWRALQARALKTNRDRAQTGSDEAVRGSRQGAANYRNRRWC